MCGQYLHPLKNWMFIKFFNFNITKSYNFLIYFLYMIKKCNKKIIFCNEPLFSLKSAFLNKFVASFQIILGIIQP